MKKITERGSLSCAWGVWVNFDSTFVRNARYWNFLFHWSSVKLGLILQKVAPQGPIAQLLFYQQRQLHRDKEWNWYILFAYDQTRPRHPFRMLCWSTDSIFKIIVMSPNGRAFTESLLKAWCNFLVPLYLRYQHILLNVRRAKTTSFKDCYVFDLHCQGGAKSRRSRWGRGSSWIYSRQKSVHRRTRP